MLKPLNGKILIKRINEGEEITKSGIILKLKEDEPDVLVKGVVVSHDNVFDINVGDTVLYFKHMGLEMPHEGQTYWMVRPIDIVGVIEE